MNEKPVQLRKIEPPDKLVLAPQEYDLLVLLLDVEIVKRMKEQEAGVEVSQDGLDYLKGLAKKLTPFMRKHVEIRVAGLEEYTDDLTGICMTVMHDIPEYPEHPLITVICPEHNTLSIEQVNEAMWRLRQRAKIDAASLPDLLSLKDSKTE